MPKKRASKERPPNASQHDSTDHHAAKKAERRKAFVQVVESMEGDEQSVSNYYKELEDQNRRQQVTGGIVFFAFVILLLSSTLPLDSLTRFFSFSSSSSSFPYIFAALAWNKHVTKIQANHIHVIATRYLDDSVSEGAAAAASGGGGGGGGKSKKGLAKEIKNFKKQQVKNVLLEELLPGTTLIRDIKLKIQVRSSHHPYVAFNSTP